MTLEELISASADQLLPVIEGVDPATAKVERSFLVVGGRAALPLSGVSWALDRNDDIAVLDELGAVLGTVCFVRDRLPLKISEMTRWQYTAYLADCELASIANDTHRFSKDYAVIDETELDRYVDLYMNGSALWGGYNHGSSASGHNGWRTDIRARPGISWPTSYHAESFARVVEAVGPRDQFLSLYHTIELLFDYVTFRKLVKSGNDLAGFGKAMGAHQRSEIDRLRAIVMEFCPDIERLRERLVDIYPFVDRAEQMFQIHSKDGNPLAKDERWPKFTELVAAGTLDNDSLKSVSLASNPRQAEELITNLVAYFIYRIRSSVAHSRIGEYVLTNQDDEFVKVFGMALIQEVAVQIFSGQPMHHLVS